MMTVESAPRRKPVPSTGRLSPTGDVTGVEIGQGRGSAELGPEELPPAVSAVLVMVTMFGASRDAISAKDPGAMRQGGAMLGDGGGVVTAVGWLSGRPPS